MIKIYTHHSGQINNDNDIPILRNWIRTRADELNMNLVKQTKLLTAFNEIARNAFRYAGNGNVEIEVIFNEDTKKNGIKIIVSDKGTGIPDLKKAMQDGFSTSKGLGLGLPGSKRLVNEFYIESKTTGDDRGTRVEMIMWN